MSWNIDKARPIAVQICEQLSVGIASGKYPTGSRLPSVRELASEIGVNPNTVQKALERLEARGCIHSVRGSGWYVNDTIELEEELRLLGRKRTEEYLSDMKALGIEGTRVLRAVEQALGGNSCE